MWNVEWNKYIRTIITQWQWHHFSSLQIEDSFMSCMLLNVTSCPCDFWVSYKTNASHLNYSRQYLKSRETDEFGQCRAGSCLFSVSTGNRTGFSRTKSLGWIKGSTALIRVNQQSPPVSAQHWSWETLKCFLTYFTVWWPTLTMIKWWDICPVFPDLVMRNVQTVKTPSAVESGVSKRSWQQEVNNGGPRYLCKTFMWGVAAFSKHGDSQTDSADLLFLLHSYIIVLLIRQSQHMGV